MQIDPKRSLIGQPVEIVHPVEQTLPIVMASPHSGRIYPDEFLAASQLNKLDIRRSEDSFVDEIFEPAVVRGAPLLIANFPRAYCDVNREPWEMDPAMFDGPLPGHANVKSIRVAGGLGTIARVVSTGQQIYRDRLPVSEAERRLRHYYRPYHAALSELVDQTMARFGTCLVVDCHSMPSAGLPRDRRRAPEQADIVLGDRFSTSCALDVTDFADRLLSGRGWRVVRNAPYAGGFCTSHYGRPSVGLHAMQIEINRARYMNERRFLRKEGIVQLAVDMADLIEQLGAAMPTTEQLAAE